WGLWCCGLLFVVACAGETAPSLSPQRGSKPISKSLTTNPGRSRKEQTDPSPWPSPLRKGGGRRTPELASSPHPSPPEEEREKGRSACGSWFNRTISLSRRLSQKMAGTQNDWRWLGCVLPLLGLVLLDRFFANFGQEIGEARNPTFTVLRWALWGLTGFLIIAWIAGGQFK